MEFICSMSRWVTLPVVLAALENVMHKKKYIKYYSVLYLELHFRLSNHQPAN